MLLSNKIKVGARASNLSKAQVKEVFCELLSYVPHLQFEVEYIITKGDKDKKTSLKGLEKTNFFTQELDNLLLKGVIRVAIHSAKDLPEPLLPGLKVIAITRGLTNSDCIVYNELKDMPRIGTSSNRREESIKKWRHDALVVDIRGTIEERLDLLSQGIVDGVVVAKCALIRLGLDHLKQIPLEENVAPLQGKLAIVARSDDDEVLKLFSPIDFKENS